MTDSNHAPNPQSTSGPPDYEGTDPDLPDRKKDARRSTVSTVQVGASAAAAVTSALAASFFGVAGTLIGAAVGSIVSTIAGALYADYLGRAGERIKVTKDVVIQRIPGEVIATTPLRHLTSPTDLPGRDSLRPIGAERQDETVAVPVEQATELLRQPEGMAPLEQAARDRTTTLDQTALDQTMVIPAYGSAAAETAMRSTPVPGRTGPNGHGPNGHGPNGNDPNGTGASRGVNGSANQNSGADTGLSRPVTQPGRPLWKRPLVAMLAVSAAGFMIALGFVVVTEVLIGHPLSGGASGTTISKLSNSGTTSKTKVTPTETSTATPSATQTPSAEATTQSASTATQTASPTATSATESTPTVAPTVQSTSAAAPEPGANDATQAP